MGQPCPADPIWHRESYTLAVTCRGCGHSASLPVWEWAALHRVDSRIRLGRLVERMTCTRCGRRGPAAKLFMIRK